MKVIPKLQDGGLMSLFTQYTPIQSPAPSQQAGGSSSREAKSSEREESTKGKLTEKDLFELVSKVDGLPDAVIAYSFSPPFLVTSVYALSYSFLSKLAFFIEQRIEE